LVFETNKMDRIAAVRSEVASCEFMNIVLHHCPSQSDMHNHLESRSSRFATHCRQTVYIVLNADPLTGLMLLGGIGVVLFQQSRLQLGWSRWRLLWHFTTRAGTLMVRTSIYTCKICFKT